MVTLRPVHLPDDTAALLTLDRSFTTERIYRVIGAPHRFTLTTVPIRPALRKEFPLAHDLGRERVWEQGLIAEQEGRLVGFAAFTHRQWNRRTELWHLYVTREQRGQGIGQALLAAVVRAAEAAGTRCIWLETSNVAYPAIRFYQRMGFAWCGLDASLYDPEGAGGGETALYFMRSLTEATRRATVS